MMAIRPITLFAGKNRSTMARFAKLGHRACDEWDEWWSEPLALGYAESYGPLAPEEIDDREEPDRAPLGFRY